MNTFREESFSGSHMGELADTGLVCVIGGFGSSAFEYAALPNFPFQFKHPLTDAIRKGKIIIVENNSASEVEYPNLAETYCPEKWLSIVAIPVNPLGGIVFYSTKVIVLSPSLDVFFVAISSLLGLYSGHIPTSLDKLAIAGKHRDDLSKIPLTDRQLVIAGLLERGFNNAQIATEIGYSESLIRQETVAIYRKLRVTGRKAMQASKKLHLEAGANLQHYST